MKRKAKTPHSKNNFLFHVTANSGIVSELVHPKLKKSTCCRA